MTSDPLLLPLAQAAAACYVTDVAYTWQNKAKVAHVIASKVNGVLTFAFAGTEDWQEWIVDFFAVQVPVVQHLQLGAVHAGFFIDALAAVNECIYPMLKSLNFPPFYISGHSKGAGEGEVAHGLLKAMGHVSLATRLYEPPRVGGLMLRNFIGTDDLSWTQTTNATGDDFVTCVPIGLSWWHPNDAKVLVVPDTYDLAEKHRIPVVLEAIGELAS